MAKDITSCHCGILIILLFRCYYIHGNHWVTVNINSVPHWLCGCLYDSQLTLYIIKVDMQLQICSFFKPEVQSIHIRKLYYSLLTDQVPISKIAKIIRSVFKCFHPSLHVEELKLPMKTCASYMRMEEMRTI